MQEAEFKKWLEANGQSEITISSRISTARRVENAVGDLDEVLTNQKLEDLLRQLEYSAEDERKNAPNPSHVRIDGNLRNGLASVRQAISLYADFIRNSSSMPNKLEHSQYLRDLTKHEIVSAMDDCDIEGLEAFLKNRSFGKPQVWALRPMAEAELRDDEPQKYPAKAIVAAAIEKLPGTSALTAKEFFNGFGESQSFKRLEELGFEIIQNGRGHDQSELFSRINIEAAMAAYDEFEETRAHFEIFSSFGNPKDFWVRSTRGTPKAPYPTKPLVGFILRKTKFNGGWSTGAAAAHLYNAGYIIVDQENSPLLPPERYSHLIREADRIRACAVNYHIEPAREAGQTSVTIRAGDLGKEMGLHDAHANICNALRGPKLQQMTGLPKPTHTEPQLSSTTRFTYDLTGSLKATLSVATPRPEQRLIMQEAKNLILYGPPGTGKTHATATEALRLCGEQVPQNRGSVMDVYNRLKAEKRIQFVTFHQSMSYEDFVEGRQPTTDAEGDGGSAAGFRLETVPGIIRRMAEQAQFGGADINAEDDFSLEGRQVFKMSIARAGATSEEYLFEEALAEGYALLGWEDIDFSDPKYSDPKKILEICEAQGRREGPITMQSGQVALVDAFRNQVQVGDIIIVSKGNSLFRAIGEVTGEYVYKQRDNRRYCHRRAVNWLWVDRQGLPVSEVYDTNFTMRSIYRLGERKLKKSGLKRLINGVNENDVLEQLPHVLIIDEINRANISKVFGELITLIEPDKRLGMENALKVRLPYSGEDFGLPPNLHILGTMNTADRSISLLDTALRRRFDFKEIEPDPETLRDAAQHCGLDLPRILRVINDRIEYLYDREHRIGHAYLIGCASRESVDQAMRHKVIPLLAEYFFEDWHKVAAVLGDAEEHDGPIAGGFLKRELLKVPPGMEGEADGQTRFRWLVKNQNERFDYSRLTD
ncbi:AAA family ATPase [uncultured Sulfitobacter sp.]|uniref:AAA family ATPase n=1 Tax=uncultured Sulfitobacter sp. TaxID=191468 RepID=UPI0032B2764A|tara:strand:- start:12415 stop:15216 length:2802 start_codon:yes stop_codon:yes gene_type:complete